MKDNRAYLLHIRDAILRILDYTRRGKRAFLSDTKTQDAVIRNLEVIGEAAKNVSAGVRERHRSIPWKSMAGMRDKMIHEYFGVDLQIVWAVVGKELPKLLREIESALKRNDFLKRRRP